MQCRLLFRFVLCVAVLAVGLAPYGDAQARRGRKYKAPPPTSKVDVSVVRDTDGKPIENAAVIFHAVSEKGNMELKSNEDGKATIDVLPLGGVVRLQIIAKGYQTYGQDYTLDKDELAIEVRMKRPGEQYSIYKARPVNEEKQDKPKEDTKPQ